MPPDTIADAVLAREDVARFLEGSHGLSSDEARTKVLAYLDELQTTQRYELYRALEYPLYPILRKIERVGENQHLAVDAAKKGRVVYASNHRSHIDYLVEPLVLDDAGIRPPIIAAGINLFGGPLGLIHKHVTGALPIRRNTKDPAYLITLKAYVSELLHKHDLFVYPEGGRSYSGELKTMKAGLLNACLDAGIAGLKVVPVAVAYDLVLEDHVIARQKVKRSQKAFSREIAELVRYAVGYRSRAVVTFGKPISLDGIDPESKKAVLDLTRHLREEIGKQYKVLPTAVLAASMTRSATRAELKGRIDGVLDTLRSVNANLSMTSADEVLELATEPLETRNIIVVEKGRYRVRERNVLRYYARSLAHLISPPSSTH
ncbi:MAG TPA: 1-acyl-sn-glycerol-3-phosphate acyltransferase [Vicinamibacterales bacterium]|nr:1-acyl-sn-glycerol-3-phosphate acyltransferase [Vicinamibacterales bacterium]